MNDGAARERVEDIFCAALELEASADRAAFLERACAGDGRLRSAVEEMLAARNDFGKIFCEHSPVMVSPAEISQALTDAAGLNAEVGLVLSVEDELGKRVGPYKLLQKIGEGGCGIVYMAEQEKPVRRRVALKVIKLGMDTKSVIARFNAERQALAMMDHPNIARVLDAGATETGRPFFVMELVRGTKITVLCDENRFDTRQRLALFVEICQAIQHAHQKGIIHRDIKPSNILVTMRDDSPVPKVIDFGIAKATSGERLTDLTIFTAYEQFVGTPAYMSPEQAQMSELDIDTRSDIYSLGVLLYELLTGKTPFDQKELLQSGLNEMRHTLLEREPHRPSTKLDGLKAEDLTQTAVSRHTEPPKLKLLLKGDLDWIVMKALEKDRNRRYQTANGLGMDVQRYLHNEPVSARPPSRFYRFQKLVHRNKTTFVAIGAVSMALIAGFGTSTWLFFKEREARQEQVRLREVSDLMRSNETKMRHESEAQAKIAQAAILIFRNQLAEADALMGDVDLPVTHPSLEAADVFRKLADWNETRGQWKPAANSLLKLVQANQIDKTDMTDEATRELLKVGPTLVLTGDLADYRKFVEATIARFSGTQNPVATEQVIKVGTILPVDKNIIQSLEPLAQVAEKSFTDEASSPSITNSHLFAWRAFALSLFEYRRGNYPGAIRWGEKSLANADNRPTCIAMSHTVMAMAYHQLNQPEPAQAELAIVRKTVKTTLPNRLDNGLPIGDDPSGLWYDWVETYLLLREATADIEGRRQSSD
jgi:serine/threonine protein kinase